MSNSDKAGRRKLLRERDVLQFVPVSRATLWRWIRNGDFPAGFHISERITVWRENDVARWLERAEKPVARSLPW